MKKIILLVFFIFILVLFSGNKQINYNLNDYHYYKVIIDDTNITTRNLGNYFKYDIEGISSNINPIINIKNTYYKFNKDNYYKNLEKYEKDIMNKLNDLGFKKEASLIITNGIKINEIYFYTNLSNLKKILENNKINNYQIISYKSTKKL